MDIVSWQSNSDWHSDACRCCAMIKIISYVVIAFFYRKTNILGRWSNILCIFNRNKGLLREQQSIGADYALLDLDENLHCIMWPLSSCYIKISVVSQCRILVAVQYMNTQLFAFFLRLTTCTCWTALWLGHCWRWLTQTELADWQQTH